MANADKPFGFRFAYTTHGGPPTIHKGKNTAVAIYPGDMLHWDGSGRLNSAASSDSNCGVALNYVSATADQDVYYYDLSNTIFEVQVDDGTLADDTCIGNFIDVTATTGNTTTLQSKQEADGDASTADTLEIIGLVDKPGNAWGTNCNIYVRFHVDTQTQIAAKTA